jgi:ABC-type branched-subunit amino acid transport system ATPase component
MNPVLETRNLSKRFGGFLAASAVSLQMEHGARHALIGPNGAGKTTLINLLTGVLPPTEGKVLLRGVDVTGMPQHKRVAEGLARTFQINQLFPGMVPLEAVTMAVLERRGSAARFWHGIARHGEAVDEAASLLAELGLLDHALTETRSLAYGRQRLLEVALALALKPSVLLLDEPAAGVPHREGEELFERLAALPADVSILLIEHDMNLVFRFARRITVLAGGAILVEGAPDAIAADPRVREVYLGEPA